MAVCNRQGNIYQRHRFVKQACEGCGKKQPTWSIKREERKADKTR